MPKPQRAVPSGGFASITDKHDLAAYIDDLRSGLKMMGDRNAGFADAKQFAARRPMEKIKADVLSEKITVEEAKAAVTEAIKLARNPHYVDPDFAPDPPPVPPTPARKKVGYVQPGRVGKKARSLYLDTATAKRLDAMAKALTTDTHSLIVSLIEGMLDHFETPEGRQEFVKQRMAKMQDELLAASGVKP